MQTQPEISRDAKALTAALKTLGVALKHTQAMEVVARMHGARNLATLQAGSRFKPDVATLAREHAISQMFAATGRYGLDVDVLFGEIEAAYRLESSRDTEQALFHVFETVGAPVLLPHIRDTYRVDQLQEVFARFFSDAARLVERTLVDTKALAAKAPDLLYRGYMEDWRIQEGTPAEELEEEAQRRFDVKLTRSGSQFYMDIALPHASPEDLEGTDQLTLMVEVNEGKPCVHLSNQMYGDCALTVFGAGKGLYVRYNVEPGSLATPNDAFATRVQCQTGVLIDTADV